MGVLSALLVGLVVGAIAKLLMPGKDPGGIIVTMLIGVAGSMIMFPIGRLFGFYETPTDAPGLLGSTLGAMLLLGIYRFSIRRRAA